MTFKHTPIDDYPYIAYTNTPNGSMVTGVTVSPLTASVAKGGNTTFKADVVGNGDYDKNVSWNLEVETGGTITSGTAIDASGKLTIASGQATTKKLYVSAITSNGIKSVAAVVTVTSS